MTDNTHMEPTDDELDAVLCNQWPAFSMQATLVRAWVRAAMRDALAKWGTLRAEKIVIPTDTMEQEFQTHYQRGYAAGQKASATQPTQSHAGAVPLTDEQIEDLLICGNPTDEEKRLIRMGWDAAHGIKGGLHGTE